MCVLLTLFVYRVAWPRWEECSLVSFSSRSPSVFCDFNHTCLPLFLSIGPSAYVSFSLVLPLKTLKIIFCLFFWLITRGFFRVFERTFLCYAKQERVILIIWFIGFSDSQAVIYMRWHSVQTCRPLQPFFWKTINSAALSSASLFFALHHSLSHFLWLLSPHKQKIYSQKTEACAWRWNCWYLF